MPQKSIELIKQSLSAAESSIKLAKQMLADLEKGKAPNKPAVDDTPGILGTFDGENMITADGKSFPVPSNYASKSMLVVGDTLKLIEEGKEKRFKQADHVKRYKTVGVLAKKDGKWKVVTPEGSYKVLPASVSHFGVDVGSEVVLLIPNGNLTVGWGAIEAVKGNVNQDSAKEVAAPVVSEAPKEEEPIQEAAAIKKEPSPKKPVAKPVKAEEPKEEVKVEKPAEEAPKPPVVETAPQVTPEVPAPVPAAAPVETPAPSEPAPVIPASSDEDSLV